MTNKPPKCPRLVNEEHLHCWTQVHTNELFPPLCPFFFILSLSLNYYGKTELKPLETLTLSIKLGACVCMRIQSCMVKCLCVATFVCQCFQVNVQCMPFLGTLMGLALMARLAYHAEVVAVRACVCLFVCVCVFVFCVGGWICGLRCKDERAAFVTFS